MMDELLSHELGHFIFPSFISGGRENPGTPLVEAEKLEVQDVSGEEPGWDFFFKVKAKSIFFWLPEKNVEYMQLTDMIVCVMEKLFSYMKLSL